MHGQQHEQRDPFGEAHRVLVTHQEVPGTRRCRRCDSYTDNGMCLGEEAQRAREALAHGTPMPLPSRSAPEDTFEDLDTLRVPRYILVHLPYIAEFDRGRGWWAPSINRGSPPVR